MDVVDVMDVVDEKFQERAKNPARHTPCRNATPKEGGDMNAYFQMA